MKRDDFSRRIRTAWAETGPAGLTRRATRRGLLALGEAFATAGARLLDYEEWERLTSAQRDVLARNSAFRGLHAGQPAFVLATGPSLLKADLSPLREHVTFGINSFFRHPIISPEWQPRYCCFLDDDFFQPTPYCDRFFDELRAKVQRTTFFTPIRKKEVIEERGWLPVDRVRYFAVAGEVTRQTAAKLDLTRVMPAMQNVVPLAMAMAIYMGCSPIYLLGADHDFLATPFREVNQDIPHFHAGRSIDRGPAGTGFPYDYAGTMEYCTRLWRTYEFLGAVAARSNLEIFNCNPDSYLDVFPFRDYTTAVRS